MEQQTKLTVQIMTVVIITLLLLVLAVVWLGNSTPKTSQVYLPPLPTNQNPNDQVTAQVVRAATAPIIPLATLTHALPQPGSSALPNLTPVVANTVASAKNPTMTVSTANIAAATTTQIVAATSPATPANPTPTGLATSIAVSNKGECNFNNLDANAVTPYLQALQPQYRQNSAFNTMPIYKLDLSVNPISGTYEGQAEISFWNTTPQIMPTIMLRAYPDFFKMAGGQLSLSEAKVNGLSAQLQDFQPTFVQLTPPSPVQACSQAHVSIKFSGKIANMLREDLYAVGTFYSGAGYFALGGFYPQLALWEKPANQKVWNWTITPMRASSDLTASEAAFFDVHITAPDSYKLVGSGVQPQEPVADTAAKTKNWHLLGGPFREFAVVGSLFFTTQNQDTAQGNVSVRVVTNTNNPNQSQQTDFASKALVTTVSVLNEFGKLIAPYPYTQYTLVEFPLLGFNGIEWPMFSQFSQSIFTSAYTGDQEQTFGGIAYSKPGTLVVIHEVIHQWWYNIVGNDQQKEPFLDEGLTEYCAYLLPELRAASQQQSVGEAHLFAQSWLDKLRTKIRQQDLPTYGDKVVTTPAWGVNLAEAGFVYYRKAPLFYAAYRTKFGDAAFYEFLKLYFQQNFYKVAHYDKLVTALKQAAPGQETAVQTLVDQWLNEKNLPNNL